MSGTIKRIVVGYHGREACNIAVSRAAALAKRTGAVLDIISVEIPLVPVGGFGWVAPYETQNMTEIVEERLQQAAATVDPVVDVATHARMGSPAVEVIRFAQEQKADLIVVGGVHQTVLERLFLGTTADRIVRMTPAPCLVASSAEIATKILVALDDSAFGECALGAALAMADQTGAAVHAVHIVSQPPPEASVNGSFDLEAYLAELQQHFQRFVDKIRSGVETTVRVGFTREQILQAAAEWGADLIVAGSHGRGFVGRTILGSISVGLLHHSKVSVLIAPGPQD